MLTTLVISVPEAQEVKGPLCVVVVVVFYQNQAPNFEVEFNCVFPLQFSLQPSSPPYTWRNGWIAKGIRHHPREGAADAPALPSA